MKQSTLKSSIGVLVLVMWCLTGAVVMAICRLLHLSYASRFPLLFHSVVCRLTGMQCMTRGQIERTHPVVYVSNHTSYLDVFVLGSLLEGSFVAKSEVAGWPVFGKLARLQNTVFLERRSRKAAEQVAVLQAHLDDVGSLIVFPEGTSSVGTDVVRFKSSLFAAADGYTIQPVSVAYTTFEGAPMNASVRENYAWYLPDPAVAAPNRPFAQHFFTALGLGKSQVEVTFHAPVQVMDGDRKECANYCEEVIRRGVRQSLMNVRAVQADELSTVT